jgi:hypothetical protein
VAEYGLPYQGSKTNIIGEIAKLFPRADHFYDLFGGGFSATHYMLVNRRKSFKHFHYNEIRAGMCELISDAIAGKYNYKVFKPDWISRDRFFAEKETSAYIKIIWSFGNNGEGYLFGKDLEEQKRSMHMAVVFDEFDSWFIDTFGIKKWPMGLGIKARRLFLKTILRHKMGQRVDLQRLERLQQLEQLEQLQRLERLQQLEQLQQLERLERLQQLEQLQQLERLELTNLDYRKVIIKPNSVIYCDIPYQGTADYGNTFSHKDFFDWAHEQANPVFISEYDIKDQRLHLIKKINHRSTFSSGGDKNIAVVEKVYGNAAAVGGGF